MPPQIRPVHPVSPAHCTRYGIAASQEDTKSSVDENCSRTYKRKISSHPACPLYTNSSFYTQSAFIQCSIESSDCSGAISFFSSPANLKEHPAKISVVKFFHERSSFYLFSICCLSLHWISLSLDDEKSNSTSQITFSRSFSLYCHYHILLIHLSLQRMNLFS